MPTVYKSGLDQTQDVLNRLKEILREGQETTAFVINGQSVVGHS